MEKHVQEHVENMFPTIDKKVLEDVGKNIAYNIASQLREDVFMSIAANLMPSESEKDNY